MNDETRFNTTYVRFFIRGDNLQPVEVTNLLGIVPSYKYQRGDRYGENLDKVRKTGFWSISSEDNVQSLDMQVHLEWLLIQLEPFKEQLRSITSRPGIHAQISCVFILFTLEWNEQIKPDILERIAALNILFGVSIYNVKELDHRLEPKI